MANASLDHCDLLVKRFSCFIGNYSRPGPDFCLQGTKEEWSTLGGKSESQFPGIMNSSEMMGRIHFTGEPELFQAGSSEKVIDIGGLEFTLFRGQIHAAERGTDVEFVRLIVTYQGNSIAVAASWIGQVIGDAVNGPIDMRNLLKLEDASRRKDDLLGELLRRDMVFDNSYISKSFDDLCDKTLCDVRYVM